MKLPNNPIWQMKPWCVFEGEDEGEGGGGEHWSDGMEDITSNADILSHAKKYDSAGAAVKAGYELTKKLGASYRLPDDLNSLSQDQRNELASKMQTLKQIPEKASDYEITRPELPQGLEYNETLESGVREFAHNQGWETPQVQAVVDLINSGLATVHNKQVEDATKAASKAEQEYMMRCGGLFETKKAGISQLLAQATEELGFGYTKDDGSPGSKLNDALDIVQTGDKTDIRQLGNKVPVLELLSWIQETFLKEAVPIGGTPGKPIEGSDFFDYKKVDK